MSVVNVCGDNNAVPQLVTNTPTLDDAYASLRLFLDTEELIKLFGSSGPPQTVEEFVANVGALRLDLEETQRLNIDLEKAYEQNRNALGNLEASLEIAASAKQGDDAEKALQVFADMASDNRKMYVGRLMQVEYLRAAYFSDQGRSRLSHELHRTLPIVSLMKSFLGLFVEFYQAGWIQMKENYSPVRLFLEAAVNEHGLEGQEVEAMEEYIKAGLACGRPHANANCKAVTFRLSSPERHIGNYNPQTAKLHSILVRLADVLSPNDLFGQGISNAPYSNGPVAIDLDVEDFMDTVSVNVANVMHRERVLYQQEHMSDWELFRAKALKAGYETVNQTCFDSLVDGKPVELKNYLLFAHVMNIDLNTLFGNHVISS